MKSIGKFLLALACLPLVVPSAWAVEGGVGRPISGATIQPYAAVVPPMPGFTIAVGESFYSGSISGPIPVGNLNLNLGINSTVSFTPVALVYIWPTDFKQWNFSSSISLPIAYVEAEAILQAGRFQRRVTDHTSGLFDITFSPFTASYHISQTEHFAISLNIWAPTGRYDPNRLATLGLNNWTFIPGIAYTKIFPEAEFELSAVWQVQFYTENPATHYQNGVLSDMEFLALKRFKKDFGLGVVFSWIGQFTKDTGPLAERFNGFRGQALGAGPIFTYSTNIGKRPFSFNVRFVPEFATQKRIQGNLFQAFASLTF